MTAASSKTKKPHCPPQWVLVAKDGRIFADDASGRLHAYATRTDARIARRWRRDQSLFRVIRYTVKAAK
jgi:hypothetical protein